MPRKIYFPIASSSKKKSEESPPYKSKYFVPYPYKQRDEKTLEKLGLAFKKDAFGISPEHPFNELIRQGVVSYDRTMVVGFCDLKGSTQALRLLKPEEFRKIQTAFFNSCNRAVQEANPDNQDKKNSTVKAVVDKFMGDGMMFYVDCGNTNRKKKQKDIQKKHGKEATIMAMKIVKSIVDGFHEVEKAGKGLKESDHRLGVRFGLAFGDKVILSVIGASNRDKDKKEALGTFSLTGEVVNLAARLEHATPSEFLDALDAKRQQLNSFISPITDQGLLRGSRLGTAHTHIDRQIIGLYEITEKKFEVRVDYNFKTALEVGLAWKELPFSPKGFFRNYITFLIGGNSGPEMFQTEPGGAS